MTSAFLSLPVGRNATEKRRRSDGARRSGWLALALAAMLSACDAPPPRAEAVFFAAEAHLQQGAHDNARLLYERFLREHPDSGLAPMARRRLLRIERELDAIVGRRGAPAPVAFPLRFIIAGPAERLPALERLEAPQLPSLGP